MPANTEFEQARKTARERLEREGISIKEWAEQNGLNPSTVYAVLNGQKKCLRGKAHRTAVLLGIKESVVAQ